MQDQIAFNLDSGIHIHVTANVLKFSPIPRNLARCENNFLFTYLKHKFDYIGTYNRPCMDVTKTAMIRVCKPYGTLEYRFFKMSYTYSEIVKWLLCCNYMTRELTARQTFDTDVIDAIMAL